MNQPEQDVNEGESAQSKTDAEMQWKEYSFKRLLERFFQAKNFPAIDEDLHESLKPNSEQVRVINLGASSESHSD